MNYYDAIDQLRCHVTALYANPGIYDDDNHHIIYALEEIAIPLMEKEIVKEPVIKKEFGIECGQEYYACPNPDCGEYIRYRWSLSKKPYPERCWCCGQVLDWEGE